jgi:hypothetical protein
MNQERSIQSGTVANQAAVNTSIHVLTEGSGIRSRMYKTGGTMTPRSDPNEIS